MKTKYFRKNLTRVLLLGLVLCLALVFSTTATAEEKVFKIGSLCDQTGPMSAATAPFLQGQRAYQRYVNEELGGIEGVKVELIAADCQYQVDKEIAAFKKFVNVDKVLFFFSLNSSGTAAMAPMAKRIGIGHMYLDEPLAVFLEGGWYFGIVPIWGETGGASFEWWLENVWKKKEQRSPNVGLLTIDNQAGYSVAIYFREYLKNKKIPIVVDMNTPPQLADASTYVDALRKAEADVLVTGTTPGTDVVLYKTLHALGLSMDRIQSIPFFLASAGLRKAAGEGGVGALMGNVTSGVHETNVPAIKLFNELWEKWYPGQAKPEMAFFIGWNEMNVTCEALRRAMKKVGYEGLTKDIKKGRKILKETLENDMRGYTGQGMFAPITYTPTDHKANSQVKVTRFAPDGSLEVLTDWLAPPPLKDYQRNIKWWKEQLKK